MKAVVFGTGSFGQLARFFLDRDSDYDVVGFTASGGSIETTTFDGLPLVPFENVEDRFSPADHRMFIAVGYVQMNRVRERFFHEAKAKGYDLLTYVSSRATHWGDTVIGENVFIFEDNTLQPFVQIGDNTVLWSGNHIGHHTTIGPHCFIASQVVVSGHVKVGPRCFIGVNATIRDAITIESDNLIGMGAAILKDTKPREVYPAARTRAIERESSEFFQ